MDSSFVEIGFAERATSIFCLGMVFAFKGNVIGFQLILISWRGKREQGARNRVRIHWWDRNSEQRIDL